MQEDKISKLIAQKLKQSQETEHQPFDLGAWEAFQQKRKAKSNPMKIWWISGIAASVLIGAIGLSVYLSDMEPREQVSDQVIASHEDNSQESELSTSEESSTIEGSAEDQFSSPSNETLSESQNEDDEKNNRLLKSDQKDNSGKIEQANSGFFAQSEPGSESQNQKLNKKNTRQFNEPLLMNSRDPLLDFNSFILEFSQVLADNGMAIESDAKREEFDFPPILPDKSNLTLGLGVSPGFGASEQNGIASANSSLGMGFLVAMDLPGKLTVGSGLGINVFNQENQIQTPPNVAFASSMSPVQEQLLVRQTQLDIPVYFQYPITTNESISLQAGFSNFISLNQVSELESSFTRQVPVSGQDALLSNSFQLRSESVVQTQQLASPPEGKFYPLATMNFGVNLRVMQSKKTAYILMPFYHLPVNQFTGFGDNPSFYGASFKVRFGGKGD
ncbi:hypothetical protein [Algoriphagus hitonicola]|uniref:Outer membrane protein beta-barrel domain-containing protein n=1 Tax=Algoriphagus hitonicola TaxID=435880 RepID=A0A1I2TXA0_9BACT|nr:hypothetical protein [Algoriphagus hitonicola]SFG67186.1 hypothetical protein SAMN04487988_106159 [Algoriphagus hitonicola]